MKDMSKENIIINNQLLPNNVTNDLVLKLFRSVDKEIFFDDLNKNMLYLDDNFFFNKKRFMLKSSILGKFLDLIIETRYLKTLNIGSGTGYSSALLSKISDTVVSLEEDKSLHEKSKKIFDFLEIKNIKSINECHYSGCINLMPYDLIFINGCLNQPADNLINQLDLNSKLVCVENVNTNINKIVKYNKKNNVIERKEFFIVNAPILI